MSACINKSEKIKVQKNLTCAEVAKRYRERDPARFRAQLYKYWNKPWQCECGSILTNKSKQGHLKTKKHEYNMQYLSTLN